EGRQQPTVPLHVPAGCGVTPAPEAAAATAAAAAATTPTIRRIRASSWLDPFGQTYALVAPLQPGPPISAGRSSNKLLANRSAIAREYHAEPDGQVDRRAPGHSSPGTRSRPSDAPSARSPGIADIENRYYSEAIGEAIPRAAQHRFCRHFPLRRSMT